MARNLQIAPINRLEADAWPFIQNTKNQQSVIAVHDAGRLGLAWAAYSQNNNNEAPTVITPASITSIEECAESAPVNSLWCGELSDELLKALQRLGYSSAINPSIGLSTLGGST